MDKEDVTGFSEQTHQGGGMEIAHSNVKGVSSKVVENKES